MWGWAEPSVSLATVRPHRDCDCGQSSHSLGKSGRVSFFSVLPLPTEEDRSGRRRVYMGQKSQKTSRRKISYAYVSRTAWRQGQDTGSNH